MLRFLVLLFVGGCWLPCARAERTNILFIYLDDFGWRDCGFMGSDFYETPHLDQLAKDGMVFTDAYAGAANCAPSRACLLSGQYTPRHEIYNVGTAARGAAAHRRLLHVPGTDVLRKDFVTWANRLQSAGYKTASIGKWHLSDSPLEFGFDVNIAGDHRGSPPSGYYPPHPRAVGLENADPSEYLTDRLSEEACKFITSNRKHPWALYLTHFAVHTPLDAKRELLAKYRKKTPGDLHQHPEMATMIEAVDTGVGQILATLEKWDLKESTAIFFTSDNGGYGPATDMAPLKGYKGTYYEGGIRVPFFVNWPGKVAANSRCSVPVACVDLYPTFCELAGIKIPPTQTLDGASLLPLLQAPAGQPDGLRAFPDRALFWHFPAYLNSYKVYGEQRDPLFRSRPCSIIRYGDWKLHEYLESGDLELYDLKEDVGESNNLALSNPDQAERMLKRLRAWQQETKAPIPATPNPKFDAKKEAAAIEKRN